MRTSTTIEKKRKRLLHKMSLLLLLSVILTSTGCLVIGGKTHICGNDKKHEERIAQLEGRIQTLEHYAGITPPVKNEVNVALFEVEKPE